MKETLSTKFMRQGACLGKDPDLFVHDEFDNNKNKKAKEICGKCDVKVPCLDYAILTNQRDGIWGETTGRERRRIKKTLWKKSQS